MLASAYHERIWESVPEGRRPPHAIALQRRFLLAELRSLEPHVGERVRVLDAGCGEASLTSELLHAGFAAVGIDVASEPLRRARARDPRLELHVVPEHGQWQLDDSSFDLVWAGEVIEHVIDTLAFFSEARRVLRSDGKLVLSTPAISRLSLLAIALSPSPDAATARFDPRGDHLRFYSRNSLRAVLRDFGFVDVRVRTHRCLLPARHRLLLASARRARFLG